ncbi:MAG: hypothetical protein ACU85E_02275 [Gammaproteobacteria bacterium]
MFLAKDFIETSEGLVFAVVEHGLESGRVQCFLRYVLTETGWQKQSTHQANELLGQKHPDYLYYSPVKDVHLHAVPAERISRHHQPRRRLYEIVQTLGPDPVEQDLLKLYRLYQEQGIDPQTMGVTGSLLLGAHNPTSDIDLIIYDRKQFHQARMLTRDLIEHDLLQGLSPSDWVESYDRRSCHLSYSDYVWHERRKYNKALVNGRKFDLNFVDHATYADEHYQKCGKITLQCTIVDDAEAYDYPAKFKIDHPEIEAVACFTATYTGQALAGEKVEVSGHLERSLSGVTRIVVGSSREAEGEYIRVVR